MKAIQLTQEQENRLVEMTRKLFPEYTEISFGVRENICRGWSKEYLCFDIFDQENGFAIHWFEFCIRYLAEAIVGYEDVMTIKVSKSITTNKHIVDSLYEQFKKLE